MNALAPQDRGRAVRIVAAGTTRYFAARRAAVGPFVDRHFAWPGTLRLHRAALGWDVLRAPANIALGLPQMALHLASVAAGRAGAPRAARALDRRLLLGTAVSREVEWLVWTELLDVPFRQDGRLHEHDALAEAILAEAAAEPDVAATLAAIVEAGGDAAFRARLAAAVETYAGSRAAAAEITTALVSLGAGAVALKQLTPGVVALGPGLAAAVAQQAAVASFPLGAGLGGVWYSLFPAAPSAALIAGLTAGLMGAAAFFTAFTGVITDPLQRRLGLHQRRLARLVAALERQMGDPAAPAYALRDHYVARVVDLLDLLGTAWRLAHLG
ncbi:MAG TPA: DUF6635 family protein [Acetobacteraceae bacterium]|nr:DUF6635 family protein [Acetobacteraceae bacterium]